MEESFIWFLLIVAGFWSVIWRLVMMTRYPKQYAVIRKRERKRRGPRMTPGRFINQLMWKLFW